MVTCLEVAVAHSKSDILTLSVHVVLSWLRGLWYGSGQRVVVVAFCLWSRNHLPPQHHIPDCIPLYYYLAAIVTMRHLHTGQFGTKQLAARERNFIKSEQLYVTRYSNASFLVLVVVTTLSFSWLLTPSNFCCTKYYRTLLQVINDPTCDL